MEARLRIRSGPWSAVLALVALAAASDRTAVQGGVRFSGTILDLPEGEDGYGPAGRFWFPDWEWPAEVDREHFWPVDPRSYEVRTLAIGRSIIGQVTALRGNGPAPTRSVTWDRFLRPTLWGPGPKVVGLTGDDRLLVRSGASGRRGPLLLERGRQRELRVPILESWEPLVLTEGGLILGAAEGPGGPLLVLYRLRRNGRDDHCLLPRTFTPVDASDTGWIIAAGQGGPVVFGPVLRDGVLRPKESLAALSPLAWEGPEGAQLVSIAGNEIAGHARDEGGALQAWVWELDPRAGSVGADGVALPSLGEDSIVLDGNGNGQVIGHSGGRPVLWQRQGSGWKVHDIRRRLPRNSGYELVGVSSINDRGQIAGTATLEHDVTGDRFLRGIRIVIHDG